MASSLNADSSVANSTIVSPKPNGTNTPMSTMGNSPIDVEERSQRRKGSATQTSRGIANLTPEQLKRKRENDKIAQREARKRTKSRIEELEKRVQELESQPLYQDLQAALRQKEEIQVENEELRRRLASVVATVQPILNAPGAATGNKHAFDSVDVNGQRPDLSQLARLSNAEPQSPVSPPDHANHHTTSNYGAYEGNGPSQQSLSVESTATTTNCSGSPPSTEEPSSGNAVQGYPRPNHHSTPTTATQQGEKEWTLSSALDNQKRNLMSNLDLTGNGERLGFHFLLGSSIHQRVPRISEVRSSPESAAPAGGVSLRMSSLSEVSRPAHTIPVRNVDPTCTLDSILLEFLRDRQREAAEGVSTGELVGPPYPSVSSLLNPAKSALSHPLSKVFTDILSTFPDINSLPEQVAVLYIMFLVMRWQIYPTQENYERLPHWISPRASQIFTPHPAWMDYLPWPSMRDRIIPNYTEYEFSNWFIPYTTTLSLNWPYEATDTLLSTAESDELVINPVFESHLRNLDNWSLGPAFAKAYPNLADTAKIKDNKECSP